MGKYLDAIELSENLKQRLESIVVSDVAIRDEKLQKVWDAARLLE